MDIEPLFFWPYAVCDHFFELEFMKPGGHFGTHDREQWYVTNHALVIRIESLSVLCLLARTMVFCRALLPHLFLKCDVALCQLLFARVVIEFPYHQINHEPSHASLCILPLLRAT